MTLQRIRNIGIVAHVDAGKTTLSERILLYTGRIRDAGEVHLGTATLDYDPKEQAMGITITAATVRCEWADHVIHLVDTPGHVDFTIEVERSLRVMDGVVVVLDGVAGVEPQTETVWRQARSHGLPAILFVNKLDRPGASFRRCLDEVASRLGVPVAPIALPIVDDDEGVVGLVDLVGGRFLRWADAAGTELVVEDVPSHVQGALHQERERLVEALALHAPAILDRYLGGSLDADALRAELRHQALEGRVVPALGGSALRNRGVQPLLDAVVAYLPSPIDRGPVESLEGDSCRPPEKSAPLSALCFKVVHDRHGSLAYVRVYSGVLREGDTVRSSRGGETRVGRLVHLFADKREATSTVSTGEVAGILGGEWVTGDTLSDPAHPIVLAPIRSPEPVVVRAIEPKTSADRDKLGVALRRLLVEDPSLQLRSDTETGQTLLAGMGELHLEIAVERLARDHRAHVHVGRPRVAYRETVRSIVEHEVKLKKQSGGPGQFAHVVIELGPAEVGAGLVFEDRTVGGCVPKGFVSATEKGLHDALTRGPLGFPMVDVAVSLLGGSFHAKDSHDRDFQRVGAQALFEAAQLASPVLLEPWMSLDVIVPSASLGDVLGDLASRRGRVLGMESDGDRQLVRAEVPLAETFGYAARLAGLSHGRGSHSLQPCRYEPVPTELVEKALAAA